MLKVSRVTMVPMEPPELTDSRVLRDSRVSRESPEYLVHLLQTESQETKVFKVLLDQSVTRV